MNNEDEKLEVEKGIICKSAEVQILDVSDDDLKKINKLTLRPLSAENVFVFKVLMGTNEVEEDRNFEPFNLNALKDLKKLYIGKTMIKDHRRTADNQIARIFDTELIAEPKTTKAGEAYTKLIAKCYMVKTESNKDLITEIEAGIKKEVSTSCRPKRAICSICGVDNMKSYCAHWNGREYDTPNGKATCYFTLDGATEAYELSFVAVGAQTKAGTTKHYMIDKPDDQEPEQTPEPNKATEASDDLKLRFKSVDAFIFANNHKEDI